MTRLLRIDPARIDEAIIAQAAALIRAGELVAFPTETVYGLGANAFDERAVARIFDAKGRPSFDPLIVHIAAPDQLGEVAQPVPPLAQTLIDAFWPGPLTLVLGRGHRIPANVSAGLPTVGVRMPSHPVALALIRAAGVPIAAPSANKFAHTSPTTAQHVLDDLGDRIPLILDGGPTQVGVESTIIDLSGARPQLLRPGGLPLDTLRCYAPDIEIAEQRARASRDDEAMPAPGMLPRHYAPRARLTAFASSDDAALRFALLTEALAFIEKGESVGLLLANEDRPALAGLKNAHIVTCGSLDDLDQVARSLYASLRDLDSYGVTVILARLFPDSGVGLAINDRLTRAAEGRVHFVSG